MNCIETLARVDVLCVDKTGTITEAEMEAGEPILLDDGALGCRPHAGGAACLLR